MSERPVFVVGFQRSGTTLLQSLLGAHPRIAAPPEVHFFFRIYDLRDYWGDLSDDRRVGPVIHELVHAPMGMLDGCGFDEDRLTQRFLGTDRSYRALLETLLADFAERQGKPRWSEKTPHQRPKQVWSLMPEAQVVHIVRDPRESVASAVAAWPHRQPPMVLADRWRAFVSASIADGGDAEADSYLQVRYEDLAADTEGVLRNICAFLGEDFTPAMLAGRSRRTAVPTSGAQWQGEAAEPVRAPRAQSSDRLSWFSRALVGAVVHDLVVPLGYPPVDRWSRRIGTMAAPFTRARLEVARWRQRGETASPRTPEERYQAVRRFLRERERAAAGDTP